MKYLLKIITFYVICFFQNSFSQTSYTSNNELRKPVSKLVWQEVKNITPVDYQFMMRLVFLGDNLYQTYEMVANKKGFEAYDMITVQAIFEIICNEITTGVDYTENQIYNTYDKVKNYVFKTKKDFDLSDIKRQEKYDALIAIAVWLGSLSELSKDKNDDRIKDIAHQIYTKYGLFNKGLNKTTNPNKTLQPNSTQSSVSTTKNIDKVNSLNDIESVILRTVNYMGLTGMYLDQEVDVLYKNGDFFTNPSEPLESFDIVKSKKEKPTKWDKWEKRKNIIYVTSSIDGEINDINNWFKVRPGKKGFKLSGKFNTSDGFGGTAVINASTVYFDTKGRFAWKTIKGGDTGWRPVFSLSNSSGTYLINNYTITLNYNNGFSESFFFGLYPKDNDYFIIGVNHFVPVEN